MQKLREKMMSSLLDLLDKNQTALRPTLSLKFRNQETKN